MSSFLRNLSILIVIFIALFILFPGMMGQVFGLYNSLGILPVFVLFIILAALPRSSRRRRKDEQEHLTLSTSPKLFYRSRLTAKTTPSIP